MASIYTSNGELKKTHIHRLIVLAAPDQFGNRYRCQACNAGLKTKSGIVVGKEFIESNKLRIGPSSDYYREATPPTKLVRDPAGRTCPECADGLGEILPLDSNGTCHGCGSNYGKADAQ